MADRPFPAERTSLSFLLLSISFFLMQVTAFLLRIPSHRSAPGTQTGMIFYRSLTFSRRAQGRMPGPPEEKQEGRHRPQTIPAVKKAKKPSGKYSFSVRSWWVKYYCSLSCFFRASRISPEEASGMAGSRSQIGRMLSRSVIRRSAAAAASRPLPIPVLT